MSRICCNFFIEYEVRKFYQIYQYVALLLIFPFTVYIWYCAFKNISHVVLLLSLPITVAYVIPALGTNVTKLWKFNNTKYKVGNFRIYHGFVLGSMMSLFGFMLYKISPVYTGMLNTLFFALISGSFIAFWNWYYDIYAIESGFITVNNKPAFDKKSAHEIATDYAPVYFFAFGFIYSIYLKALEYYFSNPYEKFYITVILLFLAALILPTAIYMCFSYAKHKDLGIFPYKNSSAIGSED